MKGRALILIFLFLILCGSASADGETQTVVWSVTSSDSVNHNGRPAADPTTGTFQILRVGDVAYFEGLKKVGVSGPIGHFSYSVDFAWNSVEYKIGGDTIGTGSAGFNVGETTLFIIYFIDEPMNLGAYSGSQDIEVVGMPSTVSATYGANPFAVPATQISALAYSTYYGTYSPVTYSTPHAYDYVKQYSFENTISVTEISSIQYNINVSRDSSNQAEYTIVGNVTKYLDETGLSGDALDICIDEQPVEVSAVNSYGGVFNHEFLFVSVSTGTIAFNQSFYTDPEEIGVDWEITDFNIDSYTYEIQVVTSVSGDPSQDSWAADGNWNTSPFISSASGAAVFDFYSDGYDLPIWIQAELWAQDKNTGTWTRLDSTPVERYHEKSDFGVGSIWTEKSTYNLSEMFYIFVETDYSIIDIELISDTYHDRQTLEVFEGGWQRLGYAFFSPHNFTAYLYEDGVITNQTSFSVWTTSPMMNIFLDSEALKTQFAFEFYTDNSSDTITGYKPDGSIFYGPITDLETGSREIIRGVSSSSPPGIYTISLFHDGITYYNDTIELYSTSEWVYFDASKYETGDRIKIYSFVTDSRQQVRLTDSIGTAVITWTDSAGYIVPNSQTVLYFSLTDNNEYGMNVNTSIDAGTFRTGNWKVEIIGIDGKPLTNESTYDYTTVSKRIDSPADSSNEMISIFFSPEGAFLLFTVALTMMGLVASKHPAGGGAGAVVGVGFGVYFNVLPVWMLMLMVIALVVLAGVSIAVHFKGK